MLSLLKFIRKKYIYKIFKAKIIILTYYKYDLI